MITEINIKNFKSIVDLTLPLSNINVFIGENGSGKSNILESVAFLSLALEKEVSNEALFFKGVRTAKPSLTFNSTKGNLQAKTVSFIFKDSLGELQKVRIGVEKEVGLFPKWKTISVDKGMLILSSLLKQLGHEKSNRIIIEKFQKELKIPDVLRSIDSWQNYAIFTPNTLALRGLQTESKKEPLGLFGEDLDVLISSFSKEDRETLEKYTYFISWLEGFEFDEVDAYRYQGYKTGRSKSRLYFRDKFMQKKNNVFSAENANEGVLHILFYLALFISKQTPQFFAIDNIETALNPKLCRNLMKALGQIAVQNDKQALITTHNPAILDGLNLHDDRQRLFVVKRNDEGHTQIERIKLKPETNGEPLKLSEMWMRGHLGGLPTNF